MSEVNRTVQQGSRRTQTISRVQIIPAPPNYCPPGTAPTGFSMGNSSTLDMGAVFSMNTSESQALADNIVQSLVDKVESEVKLDKSGSLMVGDQTSSTQRLEVSDKTKKKISNELVQRINSFIVQMDEGSQTIEDVKMPPPCQAPGERLPTLSNEAYAKAMAADLVATVTNAVMASEEVKSQSTASSSAVEAKYKDAIGQVTDMVSSVMSMYALIPLAVVCGSLLLLFIVIRSVASGASAAGGGGGRRRSGSSVVNNETASLLSKALKLKKI